MVSQYEHGPDFQTPNEAEIDRLNATITALRDRVAEVERERDEAQEAATAYEKGCEDWSRDAAELAGQCTQLTARATAAEAAIARLRDEVIEALIGITEYWNGAPESAVDAIETVVDRANDTLRALKDTHHETR